MIGGGAWLEGTTAQESGPRCLHHPGCIQHLLLCLHRTGTGYHHQLVAADSDLAQFYQSVSWLELPAGELIWLGYGDDFLYTRQDFQHVSEFGECLTYHPDYRTLHAL